MEFSVKETELIKNAAANAEEEQVLQLNELQLALIGGGCGETIL
jgi:hypothetical protein